jgi:hypothetical protein
MARSRFIRWFRDIAIADIPLVGGKNASLGEMFQELTPEGSKIPNGFAVPDAMAYEPRQTSSFEPTNCAISSIVEQHLEATRDGTSNCCASQPIGMGEFARRRSNGFPLRTGPSNIHRPIDRFQHRFLGRRFLVRTG